MTNSPIQIGAVGSSQIVVTHTGLDSELVLAFLDAFQTAAAVTPIPGTGSADVIEMVETVRAQLERPEPNRSLVKATLGALRDVTLGMTAIGGWELAVELAHKLATVL